MNFIITAQITESYYRKCGDFFNSIKENWDGRFVVGFVDFIPTDYNGEYYIMERKKIDTYRVNYPSNRIDYVCPQGGEFIPYINCTNDDVIIQIDADTIMQRKFTNEELLNIIPKENEFISVYGANPPNNLYQVTKNLKFINSDKYKHLENVLEFTPSFLVAKKTSFLNLRNEIINIWDDFIKINSHHAGIQWVISKIVNEKFKIKIVDSKYQCAEWYIDFKCRKHNNQLYINNELVIFNHNKFLK